ncbi:hypothetical protein EMIT0P44_140034 [Pseudomonas sp. IT-P44]
MREARHLAAGPAVLEVAAGPRKETLAVPKQNGRRQSRPGSLISLLIKDLTHVPVSNAGFQRLHHAGDSRDAGSNAGSVQRSQQRRDCAVSERLHR